MRESPHSARQILRALKANSVLAMLIDQDTRVSSISVPFFGRLARTPQSYLDPDHEFAYTKQVQDTVLRGRG